MIGMRQKSVDNHPGCMVARSCGPKSQVVRCAPEAGHCRFEASFWSGNFVAWARNCSIRPQATGSVLLQEYVRLVVQSPVIPPWGVETP